MLIYISVLSPDFPNVHSTLTFVYIRDFSNLGSNPIRFEPNSSYPIRTDPSHSIHHSSKAIPSLLSLRQNFGNNLGFSLFLTSIFSVHCQLMSALLKNISTIRSLLTTLIATVMVQAAIFSHLDKHYSLQAGFSVCGLALYSSFLHNSHSNSCKM